MSKRVALLRWVTSRDCICVCISSWVEKLWIFAGFKFKIRLFSIMTDTFSELWLRNLQNFRLSSFSNGAHLCGKSFLKVLFLWKRLAWRLLFLKVFVINPLNRIKKVGLHEKPVLINEPVDKSSNPVEVVILQSILGK